jgi:hypothetical protein
MSADTEVMSAEDRRNTLALVAVDGISGVVGANGDGPSRDDVVDHVLMAICGELAAVSMQLEQETAPAVLVMGQWLGGMLGLGTSADDEAALAMYVRGAELRHDLKRKIGLPERLNLTGFSVDELRNIAENVT